MIRAVFFDLYETLITEFDPGWKRKMPIGTRLGLDPEAFRGEWRARRRERHTGFYRDYRAVLREICRSMGKTVDRELIEKLYAERVAAKAAPFSRIRKDITSLLQDLREMGLKLGLISNSEPEEVMAWPKCDLAPFFDDAVFSHEAECMKPDPEIYRIACRRMGVRSEESAFVGDGGSNELEGAAAAGMMPLRAAWYSAQWVKVTGSEIRNEGDAAYLRVDTPGRLVTFLRDRRYRD
jgi:putative hydrolase of the HAD superfamily